ncbi:MAG: NUDIX hydrolase [Promethearchaeota archaeon]|jgi:8-oxo-dGTP pyrophosphatase MutT (NUDIX family)
MPVEPKLAATVVLLRERSPDSESDDECEFEVFMAKRHKNTRFMSEHHVFPGGGIDNQDLTDESKARLKGIDNRILKGLVEVCDNPSSLWLIAIRELFEETGILLASNKSGDRIDKGIKNLKKLKKYQKNLQKRRMTMTDFLTKEDLYYTADRLKYFGRLVTPPPSPIRFDTQFFLCKLPPKQNINLFKKELTVGLWASPTQILNLYKNEQIKLIFPQYSTLQRLTKFKTIQEAFDNSKDAFNLTLLRDFY